MRIGVYGLPAAGKTYLLDFLGKIDFMQVKSGSKLLKDIAPNFDYLPEDNKKAVRMQLAYMLLSQDNLVMDGHYAFGDKIVFTDRDGELYDVFLYLYVSPKVIRKRMELSEKNKKYLKFDIEKWQQDEINGLRNYCHIHNKDFYVADNPIDGYCMRTKEIVRFLTDIKAGYSCVSFAKECAEKILENNSLGAVTLYDGDKTITKEDTSSKVFGYTTHLFDNNFYTGFQTWKQGKDFEKYIYKKEKNLPVALNNTIIREICVSSYIVTSGHGGIWEHISEKLRCPVFYGNKMSADAKYFIAKFIQERGIFVTAYGDSMNDYYMLKKADKGYLVAKADGTISKSLKNHELGGIEIVRN